jgi:hypothetical protein
MAAFRKSSQTASRKTGSKTAFGKNEMPFDLSFGPKDTPCKSSVAARKRSDAASTPEVTEPTTLPGKRRREVEKDTSSTAKVGESAGVSLDFGGLPGRRVADREVLNKHCSELETFLKDLCADRRRASRDAAKSSTKPFSEASKADAMQACEETLLKEKTKLQQLFNKLQDAFSESQSTLEEYKAKIRKANAQEEQDMAWLKQLEENVNQQLNELLNDSLKPKGKKMKHC